MKSFSTLMIIISGLLILAGPAKADRQMTFTRTLELQKNDGFDDKAISTTFYDSDTRTDGYYCRIVRHTKVGEQPAIEAGRKVLIKETKYDGEGTSRFEVYNRDQSGGVLAHIYCPYARTLEHMKNILGLELDDPSIKRVPIRYEAEQQNYQKESEPRLIQPVLEKEEAPAASAIEL